MDPIYRATQPLNLIASLNYTAVFNTKIHEETLFFFAKLYTIIQSSRGLPTSTHPPWKHLKAWVPTVSHKGGGSALVANTSGPVRSRTGIPKTHKPYNDGRFSIGCQLNLWPFWRMVEKGCTAVTIFSDKTWVFVRIYYLEQKNNNHGIFRDFIPPTFFFWVESRYILSISLACCQPEKLSHPSTPPANAMHIGLT